MQRTKLTVSVGLVSALLVVGAVSGCAAKVAGDGAASKSASGSGGIPHPIVSATGTAGATPMPAGPAAPAAPSGPPSLPANALFQISATVKASSNGATADLIQTVYKPVAQNAADAAILDAQCNFGGSDDWRQVHPNSVFLDTSMVAILRAGSPAFLPDDQVDFSYSWGGSAYSGDWAPFEAACDSAFIKIPGTVHGVAPVPASDPAHGAYGWAQHPSGYGFWAGGNQPGTPDSGGTAVVSNCVVQLSAEAKATSAVIAAWATQAYLTTNGCDYES
jgi:hypothetical protein